MRTEQTLGALALAGLLGLAAGACERKKEQPTGPREVGRCENVSLDKASCELRGVTVTRIDPGRSGVKVVRVSHAAKVKDAAYSFDSFQLAVPEARLKELGAFFKKRSPVPCSGLIVRPPCNPDGTAMKLELALPSYAKPHR